MFKNIDQFQCVCFNIQFDLLSENRYQSSFNLLNVKVTENVLEKVKRHCCWKKIHKKHFSNYLIIKDFIKIKKIILLNISLLYCPNIESFQISII